MKREERLGFVLVVVALVVIVGLAVYWSSFALDNLREILERVG